LTEVLPNGKKREKRRWRAVQTRSGCSSGRAATMGRRQASIIRIYAGEANRAGAWNRSERGRRQMECTKAGKRRGVDCGKIMNSADDGVKRVKGSAVAREGEIAASSKPQRGGEKKTRPRYPEGKVITTPTNPFLRKRKEPQKGEGSRQDQRG